MAACPFEDDSRCSALWLSGRCHGRSHGASGVDCLLKDTDKKGYRNLSRGCRVLESPTEGEESERVHEDQAGRPSLSDSY